MDRHPRLDARHRGGHPDRGTVHPGADPVDVQVRLVAVDGPLRAAEARPAARVGDDRPDRPLHRDVRPGRRRQPSGHPLGGPGHDPGDRLCGRHAGRCHRRLCGRRAAQGGAAGRGGCAQLPLAHRLLPRGQPLHHVRRHVGLARGQRPPGLPLSAHDPGGVESPGAGCCRGRAEDAQGGGLESVPRLPRPPPGPGDPRLRRALQAGGQPGAGATAPLSQRHGVQRASTAASSSGPSACGATSSAR